MYRMNFCNKPITSRSKYNDVVVQCCHLEKGHAGKCDEYPFLRHFQSITPSVANKIKRDSTMTTGAAWKSGDAGPNRILRWVMKLSDKELLKY